MGVKFSKKKDGAANSQSSKKLRGELGMKKLSNKGGAMHAQAQPSSNSVPGEKSSSQQIIEIEEEAVVCEKSIGSSQQIVNTEEAEKGFVPQVKLPHNYQDIIKDADSPIDRSSINKLYDQLCSGVFLNKNTKKYWVEEDSGGNCFMLFARDMSIIWGDDSRYWTWTPVKETSDVMVDAAELIKVCWLEVTGKLEIEKLTPEITYEVAFVIMLRESSYGWEVPVSLKMKIENGIIFHQERKENLVTKPRERWIEIPVGEFIITAREIQTQGQLIISLMGLSYGEWKRGLVIKAILIQPKI